MHKIQGTKHKVGIISLPLSRSYKSIIHDPSASFNDLYIFYALTIHPEQAKKLPWAVHQAYVLTALSPA